MILPLFTIPNDNKASTVAESSTTAASLIKSGIIIETFLLNSPTFLINSLLVSFTDFGDLTQSRANLSGCSDTTRGLFAGGEIPGGSHVDTIDYITIATTGNAIDFGDMNVSRHYLTACSDATKGVFAGGYTSTQINTIDYVTIATTGNGTDFGDLTVSRHALAACSGN